MSTELGRVNLTGCNYQLRYDLLGQDSAYPGKSTVRLYGVLEVTNNYVNWSRGSASVHTSGLASIGTYYSKGTHTVITRDFEFTHDSNGNCSFYIGASLSTTFVSGDCGGTITLPHINSGAHTDSVTTPNDKNIEGIYKINYTKYNNNFTYKLRVSIPNVIALETIDYNTSGANYTMSNAAKNILFARKDPNDSNSEPLYLKNNLVELGFAIETWNGQTRLSSGNEIKIQNCQLFDADPVFTGNNITLEEETIANGGLGTTVGSSSNNVKAVNNYSKIKITLPSSDKAVGSKGAKISKYLFISGNCSDEASYSTSDIIVYLDKTKGSLGSDLKIIAQDSRGNSSTLTYDTNTTKKYQLLSYTPLSINSFDVHRVGNVNKQTKLSFDVAWNNKIGTITNTISIKKYYYKRVNSDTWLEGSTINPTINTNNIVLNETTINGDLGAEGFNINNAYDIRIVIADKILNAKGANDYFYYYGIINAGSPAVSVYRNNVGLGLPYDPEIGGRIQLNKDIKVYDGNNFLDYFPGCLLPFRFIQDSVVKSANGTSALLFGNWDAVKTAFANAGQPLPSNAVKEKLGVFLVNGDGQAASTHIEGATWSGGGLYAVFDPAHNGNLRINYVLMYFL